MESVEVFKNGKKVTEDKYFGYTGGTTVDNIYAFDIDDYETGAAFTIRARVKGDWGNYSQGSVFIKLD